MYPELDAAGGLGNALQAQFRQLGSCVAVSTRADAGAHRSPASARVESGTKFSQIYLAAEHPLYLPDFWRDGVCLAHGQTERLADLAHALDLWLCHDVTTQALAAAFPFVRPAEKARAFDEGREVAYAWGRLHADGSHAALRAFVDLARRDDAVGQLFPYTSLSTLCFSRCTGYPFTRDTPTVTPLGTRLFRGPQYEVRLPGNRMSGRVSAPEALALVKAHMPLDIKPAVKGTAESM
jgi:hypothetical protein